MNHEISAGRLPTLLVTLSLTIATVHAASNAGPLPTGDLQQSHTFARTGESIPYRLYVPTQYLSSRSYPLLVVLHGGGNDHNSTFNNNTLAKLAEERGYIVLSPMGYSRFGGFGNIYPVVVTPATAARGADFSARAQAEGATKAATQPTTPVAASRPEQKPATEDEYFEQSPGELIDSKIGVLSEAETLAAIATVAGQYNIDRRRMYLMGNSAGGVGTLYLAAKYPVWAAISPQGGAIAAWSYPYWRLRQGGIAALFVHGALDEHANAKWSRAMYDDAKADGVDAKLLIVPDGTHGGAWAKALPQIFDFFTAHVRSSAADIPTAPAPAH